jgi:hypothetical protein
MAIWRCMSRLPIFESPDLVISTQGYFWGLDAAPMVACMAFLAISHPVFTFDKLGVRNANVNSTLADYQAEKQGMTTA